jgi:hypothetical protein
MGFLRTTKSGTTGGVASNGKILLGLVVPVYYNGFSPVLNWYKTGEAPTIFNSSGTPLDYSAPWEAGLLDPITGDIKPNVGVQKREDQFFTHGIAEQRAAGANFDGERWIAEWDGTGTGFIMNLEGTGNSQTPIGSNKIDFTMGVPQNAGVKLRLTVTNQADPPRNPRIYQYRYKDNVTAGEMTNPDWRAEMAKFPTLRFMDWLATNNSKIVNFSDLATEAYSRWGRQLNYSSDPSTANTTPSGPKGGIHPSVICKVLNETGCKGHVNIPSNFTDAAVLEFAQYMRDHTTKHITYEFSNEIFHGQFYQYGYAQQQADLIPSWVSGGTNTSEKWYGYRSAQVMKIIRDAYADTSRWSGAISSQAVNTDKMITALSGVTYWKTSTGSALNVSDLFRATYYAPYYGACSDGLGNSYGRYITAITKANPAKVTSAGHGRATGDRVKIGILSGMVELNGVKATVTVVDADNFTLNGINSTGYGTFNGSTNPYNNWWAPAALWDLMDASEALYPGTNPSPYTYFNAQYKIACMTGTCAQAGLVLPFPFTYMQSIWADQKILATDNGLQMRQYEGGNHFLGVGPVTAYGGEPQLNKFVAQWGHCQESADVQGSFCAAWNTLGGFEAAKFQEAGAIDRSGCWAGIRYWPTVANGGTTDINNPLWQTITYYNGL